MYIVNRSVASIGFALCLAIGCTAEPGAGPAGPEPVKISSATSQPARIEQSAEAAKQAQAALINAKPGDVIEFGAGRFDFKSTLSLDVSGVTIRGQGPDKTFLSFKDQGQGTGGEGLLITSKEKVTLENFTVEDAKGDAIKVNGTHRIICKNLRAEWTDGPKETNGGYGFYPVLCTDVVIENCTSIGASDAGIYVGQSENIVVRECKVEKNVAGIEIENSIRADVYNNLATDNTGGILVFTMPDLPKKDGHHCRVYHNTVRANNHANFAPKGNTVASVPPGTGIMILANDEVEVFDNDIEQNQTAGVSIVSYMLLNKPLNDPKYDPFCESISVHDNRFSGNGAKPAGPLGEMLTQALGSPLPDILYDGVINPGKQVEGKLPPALGIHISGNGGAGFANFDAPVLTDPKAGKPPRIVRDLAHYNAALPKLAPVSIEGIQ